MENLRRSNVRIAAGVVDVGEWGSPTGWPVVLHHGTPGSRCIPQAWHRAAQARDLRLIGFSRPGYGESTRQPGRTVAAVAPLVEQIADAIGLDRFSVHGHSGGGPHALACAALLPERVVACLASGSVAPYDAPDLDWTAGMGDANLAEFAFALAGEARLRPALVAEADGLVDVEPETMREALSTLLSPVDRAALDDEMALEFSEDLREGLASGVDGWVDDDLAFTRPWGFGPAAISVPTAIWQGEQDLFVPADHARALARSIPGVALHVEPAHGHLSLVAAGGIEQLFDWLAALVP